MQQITSNRKNAMKQEDIIKAKAGQENHFRVPDGYFDNFTERMMAQLPEQDSHAGQTATPSGRKPVKMWKLIGACAASVAAVVITATTFLTDNNTADSDTVARTQTETVSEHERYIDEVADYAMMDNADIIACLSEE